MPIVALASSLAPSPALPGQPITPRLCPSPPHFSPCLLRPSLDTFIERLLCAADPCPPAASGQRLRMDDTSPGCLLPSLHKVL